MLEILESIFKEEVPKGSFVEYEGKTYYTGVGKFTTKVCKRLVALTKTNGFPNRKQTAGHKKDLNKTMTDGKWELTGQTIVLDVEGSVIDGGHRVNSTAVSENPTEFSSFFVLGVPTDMFKFIDTGRPRTGSQILEIAAGDTLKGVAVNSMIKADRFLSDLEKCKGCSALDFYKQTRLKNGKPADQCEAVMKRLGLQGSFLKVKELVEAENKVRNQNCIDKLKLRSNTSLALATLHYYHTSKGVCPEEVEGFIVKVFSYKNQQGYYTRLRDDNMDAVYHGETKANTGAVTLLYALSLFDKVDKVLPKNLTQGKLTNIENIIKF